jgi:hypothetical protein
MSEGLAYMVEVAAGGRSAVVINPPCCAISTPMVSDLCTAVHDLKLAAQMFLPTQPTEQTKAEIILAVRRRLQGLG